MKIILNGSICEEQEAVVSVYDHGFLYGIGLFETFRTYNGKAFMLSEHLERLRQGCKDLWIHIELDPQAIQQQIQQLLAVNNLADAYFRLSVSAGADLLGLPSDAYETPTVILYIKPLPALDEKLYEHGRSLQLLSLRRNSPEGAGRLKSFHYMNNILAKREMASYPWATGAEGLFLNNEGVIAEGIVSNLFFIRNGKCYTPQLETGILPGITRAAVIEIAHDVKCSVEEGLYDWEELKKADEIFLTNSIQEIVPVNVLFDTEGRKFTVGDGKAGVMTRQFLRLYQWKRGSECLE
ncbi:MAG: 4-amino-4-deoxychorismate lyase [Bacilli bacterium]|nr:4-amino-4-deoxychorismate lyase [Bacilli bacterium]